MRLRLALLKLFMALGASCVLAQTPQSTHWHLPLDRDAWEVRVVSDSAEVMVPSIQPMATWNRPSKLRPKNNRFDGIAVIGEARQIVGDFRASSTAVGLGTSGTIRNRGSYRVAASRWRIPLGFPLAREVADHGSMDGLGTAILMNESMASISRLEGALSWSLSPSVCVRVGQEAHHWGRGARSLFLDRHMAPALGARLWIDAGVIQYTQALIRTRHVQADTVETGWLAAQWTEVALGRGWSGALFGAVKWRGNDVGFQGRIEPHYLIPMAALRPREYNLGSADNALLGAQLSYQTAGRRGQRKTVYGQVLLDELLVSKMLEANGWWGNKWGVLAGMSSVSNSGKFGWLIEGAAIRPWTYTHNSLPLSYSHLHQPLGHPAGANFVEGRARIRAVLKELYTLRISYLFRSQGRSSGGGESLLSYAVGEMPWTPFYQREQEDGHLLGQGVRSHISRLEIDLTMPLGKRYGMAGIEAFVRAWTRLEDQSAPGAWQEPWNAGRLEIGLRQSRVMDERDW